MRRIAFLLACLFAWCSPLASGQQQERPLVPEGFVLDEAASNAISAAWLTGAERSGVGVFHGVWEERDPKTPALRPEAALHTWRFDDPALSDPATPAEDRAEAKMLAGELPAALELLEQAPANARSNRAVRLRAEILETLGRHDEA